MKRIEEYLFLNKEFPYKNKWFNSFVVKSKENIDLLEVMNELIGNVDIIKKDDYSIIIYYEDLDFPIEDVIMSMSDDFGTGILAYKMPKIYVNNNTFMELFDIYNKYLPSKTGFFSTSSFIQKVLEKDINDAKVLKKIYLSKILEDSLNEMLIKGIFNNDLNVLQTSKDIYMHRNTINNKIALIEKETNLNLLKFKDAVSIYMLMQLK